MSFHSKIVEIQQRRDRDEFEQKGRKITKEEGKEPVVDSRSQRDALIQKWKPLPGEGSGFERISRALQESVGDA